MEDSLTSDVPMREPTRLAPSHGKYMYEKAPKRTKMKRKITMTQTPKKKKSLQKTLHI